MINIRQCQRTCFCYSFLRHYLKRAWIRKCLETSRQLLGVSKSKAQRSSQIFPINTLRKGVSIFPHISPFSSSTTEYMSLCAGMRTPYIGNSLLAVKSSLPFIWAIIWHQAIYLKKERLHLATHLPFLLLYHRVHKFACWDAYIGNSLLVVQHPNKHIG